jgi:lauroyl/myristoyl acyltransferase
MEPSPAASASTTSAPAPRSSPRSRPAKYSIGFLTVDFALYLILRALIGFLQSLPLTWVAHFGRAGGTLFYALDARHRRVAARNLQLAFPEKTPLEIRDLVRENFKRIGECYCCAVKTAGMPDAEIRKVIEIEGVEKFRVPPELLNGPPPGRVFAVGHFGNFEICARAKIEVPEYQFATTYRGLRQPSVDKLLKRLRSKSGCLLFERRSEAEELKQAMARGGLLLGLFSDQHAGDKGLRVPFLGRDASTSAAPAVLALRYKAPLFTSICFRTAPGRWRIEVGDEIPTHENGAPRSAESIMADVNRAFETAVRRDPSNWFWVHNRWKLKPRESR